MISTRTPFRVSLIGGSLDYPTWYKEHGGSVISTTINKYCYLYCRYLPPFFNYKYRIRYSKREEVNSVFDIKHPSVRECLKWMNESNGIELIHSSDIPAMSGMGSSSAFTVGLLNALAGLKGNLVTKRQLARDAIYIEQNKIKENVGSQDQVACAFGGLNKIDFSNDRDFFVNPIILKSDNIRLLEDHLLLFFTGFSRNASEIAKEQIENIKDRKSQLLHLSELVKDMEKVFSLNNNLANINEIGKILNESWELKKQMSSKITNDSLNTMYSKALEGGAIGGKILGAGGGGFLLVFVEPDKTENVKRELRDLIHVPFRFENLGSQIISYSTQEIF